MGSPKKYRSMEEIMRVAKRVADTTDSGGGGDDEDDERLACEKCGSGDRPDELLLCDKCDRGFHMLCLRPIITRVPIGSWCCSACSGDDNRLIKSFRGFTQKKLTDFFKIQKDVEFTRKCTSSLQAMTVDEESRSLHGARHSNSRLMYDQMFSSNTKGKEENEDSKDAKRRRRRTLVFQKKRRRLLPYVPSEDHSKRLEQMRSLALALTANKMEFSNELSYRPGMAPRSANRATFEIGGMQVLSKEDTETLQYSRAMYRRGEFPPLTVTFDSFEGYTVEADGHIKDMTIIAEYAGDVDYIKNREKDDCDSMMTLLLSSDQSKSLVVCADKLGNISRFIGGINNHTTEGRRKQNVKCVRYSVDDECVVILVATRDIAKGERLYYDYNGYEHEYPTHNFV